MDEVIEESFNLTLPKLTVNRSSYLVIVILGHNCDQEVMEWALRQLAKNNGMIRSLKKIHAVYDRLRVRDQTRAATADSCPIKLDIGALTPEGIAMSSVGEMIEVRCQKKGEKAKEVEHAEYD